MGTKYGVTTEKLRAELEGLRDSKEKLTMYCENIEGIAKGLAYPLGILTTTINNKKEILETNVNCLDDMIWNLEEICDLYDQAEKTICTEQKIQTITVPKDENIIPLDGITVSTNDNSIYYNGEEYPIYVPDFSGGPAIGPPEEWETVYTDFYRDFDFDILAALSVNSLEGTNENVYPGTRENAITITGAHFFFGSVGALEALVSSTMVEVTLSKRKSDGKTRAIIGVKNSDVAKKQENFDYRKPFSTYEYLQRYGDGAAQIVMNKAIGGIYEEYTGKKADPSKYKYDVQVTLDERHKDGKYQSFISIDENGNYTETSIEYPGDKTNLVVRDLRGKETDERYDIPSNGNYTKTLNMEFKEEFEKKIKEGFEKKKGK